MTAVHWLIRYDPDDGEPYGELCRCDIGEDHDAAAWLDDDDDGDEQDGGQVS